MKQAAASGRRVLVLDVAADAGGALSVLREYYDRLKSDKETQYIFCVGLPELEETDTIRICRFPWVKKSWLHRLWFDHVVVQRLVRRLRVDAVLSLQNLRISRVRLPQTVYLHQALPFSEHRFRLRENPRFWIYQHIIGRSIRSSVKKADRVIVQTRWMKETVCRQTGVAPEKVQVQPPHLPTDMPYHFDAAAWRRRFFYPAGAYSYKNHALILQAMDRLAAEGFADYEVLLTLREEELPAAARYPAIREQLRFLGPLAHEDVLRLYAETVLVFPSYIETLGLPLLEAALAGAPILASDCPFSREILADYPSVGFFDPFRSDMLAESMRKLLTPEGMASI